MEATNAGLSLSEISNDLDRTYPATTQRRSMLRHGRPQRMADAEYANAWREQKYQRTVAQRIAAGYPMRRSWSETEDQYLLDGIDAGIDFEDLALDLNRTYAAVCMRHHRLKGGH